VKKLLKQQYLKNKILQPLTWIMNIHNAKPVNDFGLRGFSKYIW